VRGHRRRSRRDWRTTALAPLFTLASEFHDLQRKALVARVRALIEAKGLYSADAFNVFDADRTGTISCSELAGALAWLGLQLPPVEIHELVRAIDTDHDGMVGLDEWCAWLGDDEERAAADPARASAVAQVRVRVSVRVRVRVTVRVPNPYPNPNPYPYPYPNPNPTRSRGRSTWAGSRSRRCASPSCTTRRRPRPRRPTSRRYRPSSSRG